ncbi:hypothetical protein HYX08_05815 [Candidatus Woesearchaeota archaeon]|nr:hypothetical protein [Candidatus Woesearchaeota archaeon]
MKGLLITSRGLEQTAAQDAKELIGAGCKIEDCCISFEAKKFEELCLLCYKCQSADRVMYLLGSFEFDDFFSGFENFIGKLHFDEWILKHKKFRVECIRHGTHNFKSVDVEAKANRIIARKLKGTRIDLKEYEMIFMAHIVNSKCHFGIDFSGMELNKRGYKIFLHPNSLRGTIAYALVRESGFGKKEVMLDPFSRDGVIGIEAAFYASGFPHNYYKKEKFGFLRLKIGVDFEKFFKKADRAIKKPKAGIYSYDHLFKYVGYSKKNAKIAGVDKYINFSRVELEWLDIKFKEKSVDRIATSLPVSKSADLNKIYNEFFYQSAYILKGNGTLAVISKMPELAKKSAEKNNFYIAKETEVWSGEQPLNILLFKKKNI